MQRARRRDAAALAAGITWRVQDTGARPAVRYRLYDGSVRTVRWARDVIRDAAALAATADPLTVQLGRTRAAGIVAVVVHADAWSLVIRTRSRAAVLEPVYSLAFSDTSPAGRAHRPEPYPRRRAAWNFDDDTTVAGAAWHDMLRAVLAAIT